MYERGSTAGIAFLLFLFVLLGVSLYALYQNWSAETIPYTISAENRTNAIADNLSSEIKQFYPSMRFQKKEIGYYISPSCSEKKNKEVKTAFETLEQNTIISFVDEGINAPLIILCSDFSPEQEKGGYFVAGEGGPTEVVNTTLYAVIFNAKVSFFRDERCQRPLIALHEILHALGFDHTSKENSVLYPTLNCAQTVDKDIYEIINQLYSAPSAADIIIEKVSATKTGRYLGFEIEVINIGIIDAEEVTLSVFHDGQPVIFEDGELLKMGDIPVGTKKILSVQNAKISRSSQEIEFRVDNENKIPELDETNNRVVAFLAES